MWYCGPAALSIIFENLGLTASQKDIANIAGTNTNGTSLYGLYLSCLSYGFNSTVWMLSSSDLRINDLIVLLFDGEYHFSAVYDINESAVVLNDPSIGLFELSRETFDELFSGYVLDVEPVKDRGVKVSVTQMKSVVGTNPLVIAGLVLDPVVLLGGAVVMAAAWTGWQIGAYAGELYNNWRKHNKSPSHKKKVTQYKNPNGHYYVSYPTYGGNKGNRVKAISPSSVSYSFGNAKYYVKGHGYLSKSSLNKLGISSTQLAEIAYQESYNYYLKTKNKERLKVGEPSEFSIICRERELYKHLNAAGDGGNITKQHSLDNILTYARNLPEFSTRTSSKGTELIRLGIKNSSPKLVAKGIRYISISVISSAGFASVMVKYSPFISIIVISKLSD